MQLGDRALSLASLKVGSKSNTTTFTKKTHRVTEHSSRMESCEISCEKTPKNQDKELVISVPSKTRKWIWVMLLPLSGVTARVALPQITHHNWLLFVYMPLWKNTFCHVQLAHHMQPAFVLGHFTHMIHLYSQSIKCLVL